MSDQKAVVGYKIVDKDLRGLNGFQYAVGATGEAKGEVVICKNGLHFCWKAVECYTYAHDLAKPWRYLLVEPRGPVVSGTDKCATGQLRPQKELTPAEWLAVIIQETKQDKTHCKVLCIFAAMTPDLKAMELAKSMGVEHFLPALCAAAEHGHLDAMELAKSWGASDFNWALTYASRGGQIAAMELLKNWGITTSGMNNALYSAVCKGQWPAAELLLTCGATKVNYLLSGAAVWGHISIMELAKKHGATDFDWALCTAARYGQVDAMKMLKSWGASNIDRALAESGEQILAVELLRSWGAKSLVGESASSL